MKVSSIDHVALVTTDLDRSIAFYHDILGLRRIERPAFRSQGAWMSSGSFELHLTINPDGHLRRQPSIDTGDIHFAVRVADFPAALGHLKANGYSEKAPDGDPKRLILRLEGPAPFQQAYLLDPDNHVIELNSAELKIP
ncbi:VOC family protein [Labrys okinawensis]|uniref:VOC family protein n=1 Tax=Labrys okinawensis TaxID=346911 RepID=UPI0039BC776A